MLLNCIYNIAIASKLLCCKVLTEVKIIIFEDLVRQLIKKLIMSKIKSLYTLQNNEISLNFRSNRRKINTRISCTVTRRETFES